jgi:endoglucanase
MTVLLPYQVVQQFGTGCNLGEFFERVDHDRSAATVSPIVKAYADAGFKSIRIPVTWYPPELNGSCQLSNPTFMSELDNAIWYSNSLGMGVVLNCHFESWLYNSYDGSQAYKGKFWSLWQAIATHYNGIAQNMLIFETLNEPQAKLGDFALGNQNDPNALNFCRQVNQVAYDGIRTVSKTRIVCLTVNGMQSICQAQQVYPTSGSFPSGGTDPYMMLSVHCYVPWSFCGDQGTNGVYLGQGDPYHSMWSDMEVLLNGLANWKQSLNYPNLALAMTEFGVGDSQRTGRRNSDLVRAYYRTAVCACKKRGILPMVWNDCAEGSWFGLSSLPSETGNVVQWVYGIKDAVLGYT